MKRTAKPITRISLAGILAFGLIGALAPWARAASPTTATSPAIVVSPLSRAVAHDDGSTTALIADQNAVWEEREQERRREEQRLIDQRLLERRWEERRREDALYQARFRAEQRREAQARAERERQRRLHRVNP